ncbi:TraB/GumN family protein [Bacteroides reticulotermitis]|uniref:Lipoprotein n=2 Tax=Bacteroides reticulotermitis TaxID=1133319 RepID=W4UPM2_9BACE|nr:TraB/GumN family protein [Bacteroides reticulotermitis]MBB4044588.1 hypothetical protein [Bacteroides reticulotermitis]GAE82429.1 hypothetical protein JCM10512_631 [Bacteroides reticulotermitis JCM 10512]
MKTFVGTILFVCIALSAHAQILWKVSGNGLQSPSYIIGTHHLAPLSIKDSIAGLPEALKATRQVYGELKISDIQSATTMQKMQQQMMIQSDTTLQSLLGAEEYELVNKFSKENLRLDLAVVPKLKPAALQNNIVVMAYVKHIGGFNPQEQLDTYFQTEALREGKKVEGLETPEFQFNLLYNSTSLTRQAQLLMCTLKNIDAEVEQLRVATEAYMKQDLDKILLISRERNNDSCDPLPEEEAAMNDKRNQAWVKKLDVIMKEAPTFVAVGALHLPGDKGLLNLLKLRGYTVEPIK